MRIIDTIGKTPLIELDIKFNTNAKLFVKLETKNATFSVKDRAAYFMIKDALDSGKLKPGMEIIEPTSGNTGIALSFLGKLFGFKVNIVMPESMSKERIKLMELFGANVILTSAHLGMKGSIEKANEILKTSNKFFMPDQFNNPSNPKAHELTTGPEIFNALDGKVDVFVSGVGTGGTITGVSRFLKKTKKDSICVAVEPENSPAISSRLKNIDFKPMPHAIQGIGAGFVPKNLDLSLIDKIELVKDEEAIEYAIYLSKKEGILAGISSGANFAVAYRLANKSEYKDKNIVFMVCDSAERYLSTISIHP
ncbi:MAG: cysteine synthase A [Desulfurella sp.]|uniref:cysteine synthase A n=1 Tax=Desulfurella sp. TaxID=1962857 RepID=UPI003D0E6207